MNRKELQIMLSDAVAYLKENGQVEESRIIETIFLTKRVVNIGGIGSYTYSRTFLETNRAAIINHLSLHPNVEIVVNTKQNTYFYRYRESTQADLFSADRSVYCPVMI